MTALNYKKIIILVLVLAALATISTLKTFAQDVEGLSPEEEAALIEEATNSNTTPAANASSPAKIDLSSVLSGATCDIAKEPITGLCIGKLVAWPIFYILAFVSAMFMVFGMLFDQVAGLTLDPTTYNVGAIYQGWEMVRDTANLFFIFILLTIAIATILQIETYGAKKLLPKLITAAILINFSFLITQYVVYSANSMVKFFYPGGEKLSVMFLAGANPNVMFSGFSPDYKNIETVDQQYKNVLDKYGIGTEEDEFLVESEETNRAQKELVSAANDRKNKELATTLSQVIIAMLGTIVFILVAMFALAFAGLALLIRVVILWFLMILSPIAFLFWVVPGLDSHAKQWWSELFKQAFFAPAFFFLFGVTVSMIRYGQAKNLFQADAGAASNLLGSAFITNFPLIGYYTLLIIMLLTSVLLAKKIGGVAAQWADIGAKAARGYAWDRVKRYTGRAVARTSEGLSTEENRGKIVRSLSNIPLVGGMMGGAAIRALERGKKLGGLDEIRKGQLESAKLLSPVDQATYAAGLTTVARGNLLNSMSEAEIAQMLTSANVSPENKNSIESGLTRLARSKVEGVRLEQFKRTPENERANFFNGLPQQMQNSFIQDKLSQRELVALYNDTGPTANNIRTTIGNTLTQSPIEKQEKFADEFNKAALKLSGNDLANAIDSLPDQLRVSSFNLMKKEDVQKAAKAYEGRGGAGASDFLAGLSRIRALPNVNQQAIDRAISDALTVIPMSANAVGKQITDVANKIDFTKVSQNDGAAAINQAFARITSAQIQDIIKAGGDMERSLKQALSGLGNNVDAIADALETQVPPTSYSNWVRLNGVRRLGLPPRPQPPQQPPPQQPPPQQPPTGGQHQGGRGAGFQPPGTPIRPQNP